MLHGTKIIFGSCYALGLVKRSS